MTPLRFVSTGLSSALLWGTSAIAYGAEPAVPPTPGPAAPVIEAPPEAPKATESTPAGAAFLTALRALENVLAEGPPEQSAHDRCVALEPRALERLIGDQARLLSD